MTKLEQITDAIIKELENGNAPWKKPWSTEWPQNAVTGREYNGLNMWLLLCTKYSDPRWLTYKQALSMGGNVKKGEKSTAIMFWSKLPKKDEKTGQEIKGKYYWLIKTYLVFNVQQCENLTLKPIEPCKVNPVKRADALIKGFKDKPTTAMFQGDRAYYNITADSIRMPDIAQFDNEAGYYGTWFHEFTHSTGHTKRLNRKELMERTDDNCSLEELTAELGSAMMLGLCGLQNEKQTKNHAAYVRGWLKALKDDRRKLLLACGRAQKAVDYMRGKQVKEEAPTEQDEE